MRFSSNLLLFLLLSAFLISCTSNDNSVIIQEETIPEEILITGFVGTYLGEPNDPNAHVSRTIYIGEVADNKRQNTTREHFVNDISQGVTLQNLYEYNSNGNLISVNNVRVQVDEIKEFSYGSNENLVGITWSFNGNPRYYRFVHPSSSITYFEDVSLHYNDPSTVINRRYILEFDGNDNVIKAGGDVNLDGVMDYENIFTYDVNNNMTNVQMANGDNLTISYSTIINTHQYLEDKTYGRNLGRTICAEVYGGINAQTVVDLDKSFNINLEASLEAEYEVLDNNFYNKITTISTNSNNTATETNTLEFTFQ